VRHLIAAGLLTTLVPACSHAAKPTRSVGQSAPSHAASITPDVLSRALGCPIYPPGPGAPAYQSPGATIYPCVGSLSAMDRWAGQVIDAANADGKAGPSDPGAAPRIVWLVFFDSASSQSAYEAKDIAMLAAWTADKSQPVFSIHQREGILPDAVGAGWLVWGNDRSVMAAASVVVRGAAQR
jgi:hypothetical protein